VLGKLLLLLPRLLLLCCSMLRAQQIDMQQNKHSQGSAAGCSSPVPLPCHLTPPPPRLTHLLLRPHHHLLHPRQLEGPLLLLLLLLLLPGPLVLQAERMCGAEAAE
jgi:hypothetical protein